MTVSLQNVVDDILIHILCMLPLGDVLSVRQTSKRLEALTHLRAVWHDQFCSEVLSKGLPIPGTAIPLPEIPAFDLEWRTRLTVRVQKMWTRPAGPLRPVVHRTIPITQQVALRIGGRELLTLHNDRFITWHLDGTNKLATENIVHEHTLRTDSAWKIYRDLGDFDTIAVANRWSDIS
ncbi:hypothetical protein BDM02DRAFT_2280082 [Thelephora ganbajun]|uniref:Uncharacterized protein n=1 Tax=Thelephora ganbajun TaxID=370292 RepID=A0ACB6ZFJ0_THEGA|nr:hypothetical protein BDM02DRAFT_2280082 [Thelephora ganbajun]